MRPRDIEHQPFQDIRYIFLKMIKPDLYKVQFQEIFQAKYRIVVQYYTLLFRLKFVAKMGFEFVFFSAADNSFSFQPKWWRQINLLN